MFNTKNFITFLYKGWRAAAEPQINVSLWLMLKSNCWSFTFTSDKFTHMIDMYPHHPQTYYETFVSTTPQTVILDFILHVICVFISRLNLRVCHELKFFFIWNLELKHNRRRNVMNFGFIVTPLLSPKIKKTKTGWHHWDRAHPYPSDINLHCPPIPPNRDGEKPDKIILKQIKTQHIKRDWQVRSDFWLVHDDRCSSWSKPQTW